MNAALRVSQKGHGRAVVTGAHSDAPQAAELATWLAERVDVARFERRPATGTLYVDYDDGAALPGRFLRSLRDKVELLNRARRRPVPFDIKPVHSLPGRVRFQVNGVADRDLATLAMLTASLPGVKGTRHLTDSRTALVHFDPEKVTEELILDALWKTDPVEWAREWHRPVPMRWGAALGGTSVLFMCLTRSAPFPWLAFGVLMSSLRPLDRSLVALRDGKMSVDLLDVAATFAALATGRATTAAFVIWMVGVGDLLLDVSANKARSALSMLMQRRERETYLVLADGELERVPAADLQVGDRFAVQTGRGIVADGRVVSGLAEVDEKALTGESHLLSKKAGDLVLASTVVVEGSLVVEVECSGQNTEAAKIERILNTVGTKPLTLQRDALDFAASLVLPTFGVAAAAAALASDVTRAVCVLITDFGTGIRIAVPVSALTAMRLAAREGVLVKGAQYLERLSKTDVIIFDKTGTLTSGVPEVAEVVTSGGIKESTLIGLCAAAESKYDHPVARALKAYAKDQGYKVGLPEPASEEYSVGMGLSARVRGRRVRVGRLAWIEGQKLAIGPALRRHHARFKKECMSTLCVAVGERVVGLIAYTDGTRPESAGLVKKLQKGGRRRVVLLSGDNSEVVESVACTLGIDEAVGGLLPEQKAAYVRNMKESGCVVAMVGDGINDAPALASADVGISFAGSTDVALETADVVLLDGGLMRLERAFSIADKAMSSVRQNLGVIIAPNAAAIGLGALGLITPPIAAVINNGATLLAVVVGTIPLLRRGKG